METGSGEGTSGRLVIEDKRCEVGTTTYLKPKQNDTNIKREGDHYTDETDAKLIKETGLNRKYYLILETRNMRSAEEGTVKILESEAKKYRIDILAI